MASIATRKREGLLEHMHVKYTEDVHVNVWYNKTCKCFLAMGTGGFGRDVFFMQPLREHTENAVTTIQIL